MPAWVRLLSTVCLLSAAACDPPKLAGKGGDCHSLSDCKAGLACVEGKCSGDLEDIAGRVPRYEEPAPMTPADAGAADAGAADAGAADAGAVPDAAMSAPATDAAIADAG